MKLQEEKIRGRIQELKTQIEQNFLELAKLLSQVRKERLWKNWGFDSFTEYVEKEVGFSLRKAEYLCRVWEKLACRLQEPERKKLQVVGWTKAKEIAKSDEVEKWLEAAPKLSVKELKEKVREGKTEETPKFKQINFKLTEEQYDTVQKALDIASKISDQGKETSPSRLLEMICITFLTDFQHGSEDGLLKFFRTIELQRELKLIAVNKENQVIYGEEYLE